LVWKAAIGFPTVGLSADALMLRVLRRLYLKPADLENVNALWRRPRRWGAQKSPTLRDALYDAHRAVEVMLAGEPMTLATIFPHVAVLTRSHSIAPGLELCERRLRVTVGEIGTEPADIRMRAFTAASIDSDKAIAYFGLGVFVPAGELRTGRLLLERPEADSSCELMLGEAQQPGGLFKGQTGVSFTLVRDGNIAPVYPSEAVLPAANDALRGVIFFLGKLRDDQPLTLERLDSANAEAALQPAQPKFRESAVEISEESTGVTELRNTALLDTPLILAAGSALARLRVETSLNGRPFHPESRVGQNKGKLRLSIIGFRLPRARAFTYTARWWVDFDPDGHPVYCDLLPRRFRLFATAWRGIFWAPFESRDDPQPFIDGVPFGPNGNEFILRRVENHFLLQRQHAREFGSIHLPEGSDPIEVTISPTDNPRAVSLNWLDIFGMVEDGLGIVDGIAKQHAGEFPISLVVHEDRVRVTRGQAARALNPELVSSNMPERDRAPRLALPSAAAAAGRRRAPPTPTSIQDNSPSEEYKFGALFRLGPLLVRIQCD